MTCFNAGGAEMSDRYHAIPASIHGTKCCAGLVDLAFDVRKDAGFLLSALERRGVRARRSQLWPLAE